MKTLEYFDLLLFPFHPLYTFGVHSDVFGGFSKSSLVCVKLAERNEEDYVKSHTDKINFIDAFDKTKLIAILLVVVMALSLVPTAISVSDKSPQISGSLNAGGFVNEPFTWNYSFYVSDPDGDTITATSDDPEHITWNGLVATCLYTEVGDYPVKLTFTDSQGANISETGIIKIVERRKNEFIRAAHGGALKKNDGHVDVDKTIEALKRVYANAFVLSPNFEKQWEDILNFLPEANENNIIVFLILPDARYGICPCGGTAPDPNAPSYYCKFPKPYCKDYIKWMEELANLSLQYPVFEGVFIDDFECGAFSSNGGFTTEYIEKVMQAKNRINPNFKFLPGVYLPRGLSEFNIKQCGGYAGYNKFIRFSTTINYAKPVEEASFELISYPYKPFEQFVEQIQINDEIVWERRLDETPRLLLKKIDLTGYDLSNTEITYKLLHDTSGAQWLSHFVTPLLYINGQRIELNWSEEKNDEHYAYEEYYKWVKQYYDLTDGVVFFSNAFDLVGPENEIIERLLDMTKEKVGENKIIFGHFYGAEPWKEPVFPSEHYFDTFAKINTLKTDGVKPWFAFLLPYYLNYSSGIYSQPVNNKPEYDYRFSYPAHTSFEVGFYQGIKTLLTLPENITDATINFDIEDNKNSGKRMVKELVIKSGEFELNWSGKEDGSCLWFRENGTLWFDYLEGNEGKQNILVSYEDLSDFFVPGRNITLILRMRADGFGHPHCYYGDVNIYVTKPKIMINGEEVQANWSFVSGNALENHWLKSSEKIKGLYKEIALGPYGTLLGTVFGGENPIPNATITANEYETTTNDSGYYLMELPLGTYTVTASAEGYEPASENITIASGNKNLNFSLSRFSAPTSIFGNITYGCNETGLAGVSVNLTQNGTLVNSTVTDGNGNYTFTDVSPGDYNLTASKIRFWSNSTSVTVNAGASTLANLTLWLKGDLNNDGTSAGIEDVAMMDSAWKDEIPKDFRYDLNNDGTPADIGDRAMMESAWEREIVLM